MGLTALLCYPYEILEAGQREGLIHLWTLEVRRQPWYPADRLRRIFSDEWLQEWQGPRTRAILEPTNRLLLTLHLPGHLLGPRSTMLLLFKTGPKCPGAGCQHPSPQTAAREVWSLLRGLTASWKNRSLGSALWGWYRWNLCSLAKVGLGCSCSSAWGPH